MRNERVTGDPSWCLFYKSPPLPLLCFCFFSPSHACWSSFHCIYHVSHIFSVSPSVSTPCPVPDGDQIFTNPKQKNSQADFKSSWILMFLSLSPPLFQSSDFPSLSFPTSLCASSPIPDGDDAFSASRQHWPSACGLVPVHLLWLLCQPSAARLSVQLPARHRRVSCTHLW